MVDFIFMKELTLQPAKDIEKIYSDMQTQFPPDELKGFSKFAQLSRQKNYHILETVSPAEAGYLIFFEDVSNRTIWLDYFAVYKNHHCKGYGTKMLKALFKKFSDYKGCWLEVEKPDTLLKNTIRRIAFYKSLGAQKINCEYIFPNENGGLEMDLYFIPFTQDDSFELPDTKLCVQSTFEFLHGDLKNTKDIFSRIKFK